MAERTLHGYEQSLVHLADTSKMSNQMLQSSVVELETMQKNAAEQHLERQRAHAARLIGHYSFERAMREGMSPAMYRELMVHDEVEEVSTYSTDVVLSSRG